MTKPQLSVCIVIPAYNEERNIGNILDCVFAQQEKVWFQIAHVDVVSDASNDGTDDVVASYAQRDPRVRLISRVERSGKAALLNQYFSEATADALVLLDADVLLPRSDTIALMLVPLRQSSSTGLVSGNPRPIAVHHPSIAQRAAWFSWLRADALRARDPNGFMGAAGPIMAISRDLYTKVNIPDIPGTDQSLFLACLDHGVEFRFVRDAFVSYRPPATVHDYVKQSMRFRVALKEHQSQLGRERTRLQVTGEVVFGCLASQPVNGACWVILNCLASMRYRLSRFEKKRMTGAWQMAHSTK